MFGVRDRGASIGRYRVVERLGAGGMGVVYSAFDERLGRHVAIKVLHADVDDDDPLQLRLVREAQLLARLNHPHVVQIFEVGRQEGRVYLVMELVDGPTVAIWQTEEPRAWRDILDKYTQAGRGLAAAHELGVVHRDVKPANLLLGVDGRVRVVDFGLARHGLADADLTPVREHGSDERDASADSITRPGDLMGTPGYMSPEHAQEQVVDARSDQFSFCVALFEALFGERPHRAASLPELLLAISEGTRRSPPRRTPVPRSVLKALERGLSTNPADRFESMHGLVDALEGGRRRAGLRLAALVGVGLAGVGALLTFSPAGDACQTFEHRLAEVWNPEVRSQVSDAIPAAAENAAVLGALDEYALAWRSAASTACAEPPSSASVQPMYTDRRLACLVQRRDALESLVEQTRQTGSSSGLERVAEAAMGLPSVEACNDTAVLSRWLTPPPVPQARAVRTAQRLVEQSHAALTLGRFADARGLAAAAVTAARDAGYGPVIAAALLEQGKAAYEVGEGELGERALTEAVVLAEAHRHDEVAARAWVELLLIRGTERFDPQGAEMAFRQATAAIARMGDEPVLLADMWRARALSLREVGRWDDAVEAFDRARQLLEEALPEDDLRLAWARVQHATVEAKLGNIDAALPELYDSLQTFITVLGPRHPRVGKTHLMLGLALEAGGRLDDSRRAFRDALAVYEHVHGPRGVRVTDVLEPLARLELTRDANSEALAHALRAIAIHDASGEPGDRATWRALLFAAQATDELGEPERSLAFFRRAFELLQPRVADNPSYPLGIQVNIGLKLQELGRDGEAVDVLAEAVRGYGQWNLATDPKRVLAVSTEAQLRAHAGQHERAVAQLRIVLDDLGLSVDTAGRRAELLFRLARVYEASSTAVAARSAAKEALALMQRHPDVPDVTRRQALVPEIEAWLADVGGDP